MNVQNAKEILKENVQCITESRLVILTFLMQSPKAYALSDIERDLDKSMDRVTVYRTLNFFTDIGLALKIVDHKGTCPYLFNHESHDHIKIHPHLRCKECNTVVCLPSLPPIII